MTDAAAPTSPMPGSTPPPRGLWNRLKAHILHPELHPEQVAWSFALGLSIAWNPLLGLHTGMVFLFCVIFRRLHRPLMIMAMLINNPWTMVPIATASTWVGILVRGRFICTVLALPIGYFFMLWLAKRLRRIHWPHLHHASCPPHDIPPGG